MDSSLLKENPKQHQTASCVKNKKDPLPMKLRALPHSFWQQPNTLADVSPTTYCPPFDNDAEQSSRSEVVGVANTELLFSLFQSVETDDLKDVKMRQLPVVRRGRPRKQKNKTYLNVKKDIDPYFTSATVPYVNIIDEDEKIAQGQQVFASISVAGEHKNVPISNTYSEKLTNLVVNL